MFLILLYLLGLHSEPYLTTIQYPTETKMSKYPLELFEFIRDSIADCNQDCKKFVDDELRAERKVFRDSIPQIFAGVRTIIDNSALAQNLSDHIMKTETLNRYLEERVCSLEQTLLQQSYSRPTPVTSPPAQWSTPLHSSASTPVSMAGTMSNQGTRLVRVELQGHNNIQFLQPSLVQPDPTSDSSPSKASPTQPHPSPQTSPLLSTQTLCDDYLMQVDGNMTLSNLSDPAIVSAGSSCTSLTNQMTPQYNYTLNSVNQTKRLFENSSRPPIDIRYSNPMTINGHSHPTNVSIDFNSGVYLSAVKPALDKITAGWQLEILSTLIQCEEVSPRSDISGRKVCTKMVLYLRENHTPSQRAKVVLHFYHTSNSLQVQGSQVMSTGVSSPVWLVTHFLEPLASSHATQHAATIDAINDHIQTRVFQCKSCELPLNPAASNPKDQQLACNKCQNLFHKKCTDRKKTTANWRRNPWYCTECITGPQVSIPTSHPASSEQNLAPSLTSSPLNPTASTFTPAQVLPAVRAHHSAGSNTHQAQYTTLPSIPFIAFDPQTVPHSNPAAGTPVTPGAPPVLAHTTRPAQLPASTSATPIAALVSAHQTTPNSVPDSAHVTRPAQHPASTPVAPDALVSGYIPVVDPPTFGAQPLSNSSQTRFPHTATNVLNPLPLSPFQSSLSTTLHPHTGTSQSQRFPSNIIRQRKSNVAVLEPEKEFQQAAIDACRSTIAQQEADLKKLNEAMDIRNKKVMQLERQVGVATSYLSSREGNQDNSTNVTDQLAAMIASLNKLITKLVSEPIVQKSPSVNVYNSLCHLQKPALLNKATQTSTDLSSDPPPTSALNMEPTTVASASDTDTNNQLSQNASIDEIVLACTICDRVLETSDQLDHHMEAMHGNSPLLGIIPENRSDDKDRKCDHCDEVFSTSDLLQTHKSEKHPADFLQCSKCMLRFQDSTQLREHTVTLHDPTEVSAGTCEPRPPAVLKEAQSTSSSTSSRQFSATSNKTL